MADFLADFAADVLVDFSADFLAIFSADFLADFSLFFRSDINQVRRPGDLQRESGRFARIDSHKKLYFHNV